jgi:hypothetical protein
MLLGATTPKNARLLLRDRGALASLFALPPVFVVLFGSMFGGGGDRRERPRDLAVVRAQGHAAADRIVGALEASELFAVQPMRDADALKAWVGADGGRIGLIIPPDFDPAAKRPAELVIDPQAPLQFLAPIEGTSGRPRGAISRCWSPSAPAARTRRWRSPAASRCRCRATRCCSASSSR